jgi:hypothetical protein
MDKNANKWVTVIFLVAFAAIIACAAGRQATTAPTNVLVTNSTSQPVPVRIFSSTSTVSVHDVARGKDLIQLFEQFEIADGQTSGNTVLNNIPGERLVITNVACQMQNTNLLYVDFSVQDSHGHRVSDTALPVPAPIPFSGITVSLLSQNVQILLDPGQVLTITGARSTSSGLVVANVTVEGYRVSYP